MDGGDPRLSAFLDNERRALRELERTRNECAAQLRDGAKRDARFAWRVALVSAIVNAVLAGVVGWLLSQRSCQKARADEPSYDGGDHGNGCGNGSAEVAEPESIMEVGSEEGVVHDHALPVKPEGGEP